MRIDFVRFSNDATCTTKGSVDAAGLTFILLKKLLFHPQMLELYKQILVLKFLRDILVKYMQD